MVDPSTNGSGGSIAYELFRCFTKRVFLEGVGQDAVSPDACVGVVGSDWACGAIRTFMVDRIDTRGGACPLGVVGVRGVTWTGSGADVTERGGRIENWGATLGEKMGVMAGVTAAETDAETDPNTGEFCSES